jgi:hypothetical protein
MQYWCLTGQHCTLLFNTWRQHQATASVILSVVSYWHVTEVENPLLSVSPTGSFEFLQVPDSPEPEQPHDFGIGSVVEVTVSGEPRYGVIRWIGIVPEDKKARKVAGIEMVS